MTPSTDGAILLRGSIVTGKGEAAGFMQLPWVRDQIASRLGFDPYPGTLNLRVEHAQDSALWQELRGRPGVLIEPAPGFCAAHCYPVSIEGRIPGAILLPLLADYPADIMEVIAPLALREAIPAKDGSPIVLAVTVPCPL